MREPGRPADPDPTADLTADPIAGPLARVRRIWHQVLRPLPGGWWLDAALIVALALLTLALATMTPLLRLDVAVADWCDTHRPFPAFLVAGAFNYVGQGTPLTLLTLGLGCWRAVRCRSVRPPLVAVVTFGLTYLTIGPLKVLTDRAAPHAKLAEPELMFAVTDGMSYPSGHVVNALAWYCALTIVLGDLLSDRMRRILRFGAPAMVVVTTTYLGWHWISDDVAGLLLGIVLVRVLLRIRWHTLPLGRRLARADLDHPFDR